MHVPSDIEIAQGAELRPVTEIAEKLGIGEDELVEVTPKSIRLRKVILDRGERYRQRSDTDEKSEPA